MRLLYLCKSLASLAIPAPINPRPPACATLLARSGPDTPFIGAAIMGADSFAINPKTFQGAFTVLLAICERFCLIDRLGGIDKRATIPSAKTYFKAFTRTSTSALNTVLLFDSTRNADASFCRPKRMICFACLPRFLAGGSWLCFQIWLCELWVPTPNLGGDVRAVTQVRSAYLKTLSQCSRLEKASLFTYAGRHRQLALGPNTIAFLI